MGGPDSPAGSSCCWVAASVVSKTLLQCPDVLLTSFWGLLAPSIKSVKLPRLMVHFTGLKL